MELTAASSGPVDVSLKFFTMTHSYDLTLTAQQFVAQAPRTVPTIFPFASRTVFAIPDDDAIVAATAESPSDNPYTAPCPASSIVLWDALRLGYPNVVSAADTEAKKQFALSFGDPPKAPATASRNAEPEPKCTYPYRSALAIKKASANYPESARAQHASGRVMVIVTLATDGSVVAVKVYLGSGTQALDDEAMRAAANSTYAPETFRCEALSGSYTFVVDFAPW